MIKSMTGYGRAQAATEEMEITVELKSVNHRYFEFSSRIPRQFIFLEDKLKAAVQDRVSRGKVDLFLSIYFLDTPGTKVSLNLSLAESYTEAMREMIQHCGLTERISASDIAKFPDVLTVTKEEADQEKIWKAVQSVLNSALDSFISMRESEGTRLKADIKQKGLGILEKVSVVEARTPETVKAYRARIEEKIRELLGDTQIDEQRLLTETAVFADKIAVDEETVRLKSHVSELNKMLELNEPIGRKLDFLLQEMNRETNTIGSKANDVEITRIVVDMKSELEKIREQIQNIE